MLPADHTGVPRRRRYDLVCAFEVLEHLADDAAALADWVPLVRPGGHLMLSVPAFARSGSARWTPGSATSAGTTRTSWPRGWPAPGWSSRGYRSTAGRSGYALEAVRNRMDARHLAAAGGDPTPADRTAASGRHQQPGGGPVGRGIELATLPFRYLQRLAPERGTGLVAVATRPA